MKNNQQFERIGTLSLDEVFPLIEQNFNNPGRQRVQIGAFYVNVQSLRLRTFLKTGVKCSCCENSGSFFAVERSKVKSDVINKTPFHLNLYGYNKEGEEVLFTHDHIIARALGGNDHIDNTITSCGPCNWRKGVLEKEAKEQGQTNIELDNLVSQSQKLKLR